MSKSFNEIMAEVGAREVPDPETEEIEEKRRKKRRKVEVESDAETREVVLCEATAVYDAASGNMVVSVPLAEDDDAGRENFNRIMDAVGLRRV